MDFLENVGSYQQNISLHTGYCFSNLGKLNFFLNVSRLLKFKALAFKISSTSA